MKGFDFVKFEDLVEFKEDLVEVFEEESVGFGGVSFLDVVTLIDAILSARLRTRDKGMSCLNVYLCVVFLVTNQIYMTIES